MNQRIQQLALEAEVFAKQNNGNFHYFYTRKLSELIVGECIFMIENAENGYQDYRNQIENGMRNHCISLIKNKFGIKE